MKAHPKTDEIIQAIESNTRIVELFKRGAGIDDGEYYDPDSNHINPDIAEADQLAYAVATSFDPNISPIDFAKIILVVRQRNL